MSVYCVATTPSVYYASIQWNAYLFFAIFVGVCGPLLLRYLPVLGANPLRSNLALAFIAVIIPAIFYETMGRHVSAYNLVFVPWLLLGMASSGLVSALQAYRLEKEVAEADEGPTRQTFNTLCQSIMWRFTPTFLGGLIVYLLLDIQGIPSYSPMDYICSDYLLPGLGAVLVILTACQRPGEASLLKTYLFESIFWTFLGDLSFSIYLFHDVIAKYYARMAMQSWGSVMPPRSMSSNDLQSNAWFNDEHGVGFKFCVGCVVVLFCYLVQRVLIDGFVNPVVANLLVGGTARPAVDKSEASERAARGTNVVEEVAEIVEDYELIV